MAPLSGLLWGSGIKTGSFGSTNAKNKTNPGSAVYYEPSSNIFDVIGKNDGTRQYDIRMEKILDMLVADTCAMLAAEDQQCEDRQTLAANGWNSAEKFPMNQSEWPTTKTKFEGHYITSVNAGSFGKSPEIR